MPEPLYDLIARCWPNNVCGRGIEANEVEIVLSKIAASSDALALDGYPMELFRSTADGSSEDLDLDDAEQLEDLQCGVCRNIMKDPMVVPCGHSFCRYCIEAWYAMGDTKTCPCCRAAVTQDQTNPSLALRSIIGRKSVTCQVCVANAAIQRAATDASCVFDLFDCDPEAVAPHCAANHNEHEHQSRHANEVKSGSIGTVIVPPLLPTGSIENEYTDSIDVIGSALIEMAQIGLTASNPSPSDNSKLKEQLQLCCP